MTAAQHLTAEEFTAQRDELPDVGRWTELAMGKLVQLSAPAPEHGTCVLNVGKALAGYQPPTACGYAVFELGLILQRSPDTVRCPAVSYFLEGTPFAESDNIVTETRPHLVIEVASSSDRRGGMADRVRDWLRWGVRLVWVLDPSARQAHVFEGQSGRRLSAHQTLHGGERLRGFQVPVGSLFEEPAWWKPNGKRIS